MKPGRKPGVDSERSKSIKRFEALRSEYPAEYEFFDKNRPALIELMEEVRSEEELSHLRQNVETGRVQDNLSYEYPSTSVFAVEDLLIDLLDFKRELLRQVGKYDRIDIQH